jgi:hypothetical protein
MEKFVKPEFISIKNHLEINEKWIQTKIAEDPSILGLGDLLVKDIERTQPSGGRLDLLLYDPENNTRYEVELQLGKSDESHIIRTIEYWDYERRRYPQYDHCAVLIAEDITSRFLNVVSLLNGNIPIMALQMKAIKIGECFSLYFTTVIDALSLGRDDGEEDPEPVDRKYWENKGSDKSVKLAENILGIVSSFAPGYTLKFNKYYIGMSKNGVAQNFISFTPRKTAIILSIKHERNEDIDKILDSCSLDVLPYDRQWNQYRIRLNNEDLDNNKEMIMNLIGKAYKSYIK